MLTVPICVMDANTTNSGNPECVILTHEQEMAVVRKFLSRVGTGFKTWDRETRVAMGKLNAAQQWATKRAKYGPSGRKPNDYSAWRKARGLPPVEETFDTDKEKP